MTDILFTHSYFYRFDPKQWKTAQPYPPYGTLCAAAVMREAGFTVDLFDTALLPGPEALTGRLHTQTPRYLVIYDDGFNYLTKMCLTRMREAAFRMIGMGKTAGCTVIVHSSDSADHHEAYLSAGADAILLGEGELSLRELIFALEGGQSPLGIPGVACTAGKGPARPVLADLDSLPDPAWDLVDMDAYRRIWQPHHGYFSLNIATTRGCPFKCNWCAKPIYGNRYHSRSPQRVADEIEGLIRNYGVQHIWFADDIFGLKPQWVQQFRDIIRQKGLSFRFKMQSRADLLLKADTITALAEAGLEQVWIGAESGSQRILDAMDKGITVEEIRTANRLLKAEGVSVCLFLQFGYLGETMDDIQQTLTLLDELEPHDIGISVSYPLPGTVFYEKVRHQLGEKQNWVDSNDLDLMYPSTYPPAFYKRLHRQVHRRFRMAQGRKAWSAWLQGRKADWRIALKSLYYPIEAVFYP